MWTEMGMRVLEAAIVMLMFDGNVEGNEDEDEGLGEKELEYEGARMRRS